MLPCASWQTKVAASFSEDYRSSIVVWERDEKMSGYFKESARPLTISLNMVASAKVKRHPSTISIMEIDGIEFMIFLL